MATSPNDGTTTRRRRSNRLSAFAVGIVLLLGAGWYYLSARSASEHLARNSFRQLNNLTDQADAVMLNFPHLFNFLPVAANVGTTLAGRPTDTAHDCSAATLETEADTRGCPATLSAMRVDGRTGSERRPGRATARILVHHRAGTSRPPRQ
jgi:hypothetical protein